MKTSTRLILLLTMSVSAVMALVGIVAMRQRVAALAAATQEEVRAHAVTLRIALEEDYATGRQLDAQRLINRLSAENPDIYGVILFDENGEPQKVSERLAQAEIDDLEKAREVIKTGQEQSFPRRINGVEVSSFILPLQLSAQRRGALEISLPVNFIEDNIAQERRDILIILVALCITIFLVVAFVTNYSLVKPVKELLNGAEALGRGDLSHHVQVPHRNKEFALLAQAFNRMADSLAEQRRAAERAAAERLELERRLRHSERLAAVGHLAAGVAHEIGGPLQVIDGRAKQLQEQTVAPAGPPPAKLERNLTIIRKQTERITRLVRNLLDLSRPYHPRLKPVNLREVLAVVLEALETQMAEAGVVVEQQESEPIVVLADASLLNQVFLNICRNAVQAMPQGGVLRVTYAAQAAVREGASFTVVRLADTGGGIAQENLENIFNPFFTTKEVGHGTGLGLTVSNRIIEEHGGWIEAANWQEAQQHGALFAVYLPSSTKEHAADNLAEPLAVPAKTTYGG